MSNFSRLEPYFLEAESRAKTMVLIEMIYGNKILALKHDIVSQILFSSDELYWPVCEGREDIKHEIAARGDITHSQQAQFKLPYCCRLQVETEKVKRENAKTEKIKIINSSSLL